MQLRLLTNSRTPKPAMKMEMVILHVSERIASNKIFFVFTLFRSSSQANEVKTGSARASGWKSKTARLNMIGNSKKNNIVVFFSVFAQAH